MKNSIESRKLPKFDIKNYIKLNNSDIIKKGDVVKHKFISDDFLYVQNSIGQRVDSYYGYSFYRLKGKTIRKIV